MTYSYNYPRPSLTTDIILISSVGNDRQILLIERKSEPYKGFWALPGGFVEMDEELDIACLRELQEETGITINETSQFYTFGAVGRDPRGRTVSVVYWSKIDQPIAPVAGDDASSAKWFNLNELPVLAFDHQKIISKFLDSNLM